MVRKMMIGVLGIGFTFGAAAALDVGVGGFYAPARVVGYVDETRDFSEKEFSLPGVKGRVSLGVYEGLSVALGVGYNDFVYREEPITIEEAEYVTSIPTIITTVGAFYGFALGHFTPFAGGGAALARESAEAYHHTTTDWYGGLYAEAGARYFVTNGLAVEAAPRYTFLFDEPVVAYDDWNVHGFVRSEHHSQLVELLVGVNYYF
jgi:opacity protein-like surface antigen